MKLPEILVMKFESLKIEVPAYGEDKGKLVAELAIKGEKSQNAEEVCVPDGLLDALSELDRGETFDLDSAFDETEESDSSAVAD